MKISAFSSKEVKNLNSLSILDTKQEPLFEDMTYLASEICEVSISLISLFDEERERFKSNFDLNVKENNRGISFCSDTILQEGILEIEDTMTDIRFSKNRSIPDYPNTRFYAGAPLIGSNGIILGTLCVIDDKPKKLNQKQRKLLVVLARDIVTQLEMRKKPQNLTDSIELHMLVSETNQDYIFVKDEKFNIVYANKAFKSLYPAEMQDKIIGHTTLEEYSEKDAELFLEQDKIAFRTGMSQKVETLVLPDNGERTLITTKRRFLAQQNKVYILGVSRDITDHTNLVEDLERSNKDLDDFAQIASHDLKAPLNAIKSLLGFIQEDCQDILPDESVDNFSLIHNRVMRMQTLLDDMLNYAKISKEKNNYEEFNLKECVNDLGPLIDKPPEFMITSCNEVVRGPMMALKTIVLNLISNAVKHRDRDDGQVVISTDQTKSHYKLIISDDGPGIESKYHERVFKLFQTLKPRDVVEGSGMGLATVRRLIENYQGTVRINGDKEIGTGSEFIVSWPKHMRGQA